MIDILDNILLESELISLFSLRIKDDNTDKAKPFIAYRVKTNIYKIRAFELWGNREDFYFRIYHSNKINEDLKQQLSSISGVVNDKSSVIDYKVEDYIKLGVIVKKILLNDEIINICKNSSTIARTSKFEGLDLPDIDVSESNVMGQIFTWRDIISIWEDDSENNNLKKLLSRKGIYIQRSKDGKSRYVGSAYGNNGIIGRWMKHLNSNGDAQYLNLFILENGYNEIVFSVLEFYNEEDIIKRENMWKEILGTVNYGVYNGIQLNNN